MKGRERLQKAVLRELISYNDNLIPALKGMIKELQGEEKEDTDEFLNEIINGINWEIEVYNQCASLISKRSNLIDKKMMIQAVNHLGDALNSGEKLEIAKCLEQDFLPFLNKLALAAKKVVKR